MNHIPKKINGKFGKKEFNTYEIIERKFHDGNTWFFIRITEKWDSQFGIDFSQPYIYPDTYNSKVEAENQINGLKEADKMVTIKEEIIHKV